MYIPSDSRLLKDERINDPIHAMWEATAGEDDVAGCAVRGAKTKPSRPGEALHARTAQGEGGAVGVL
jgi:hypothetical protein